MAESSQKKISLQKVDNLWPLQRIDMMGTIEEIGHPRAAMKKRN